MSFGRAGFHFGGELPGRLRLLGQRFRAMGDPGYNKVNPTIVIRRNDRILLYDFRGAERNQHQKFFLVLRIIENREQYCDVSKLPILQLRFVNLNYDVIFLKYNVTSFVKSHKHCRGN